MAQLVFIDGPWEGKMCDLPKGGALVGRNEDCELLLEDDDAVSARHAHFREGNRGSWVLEDLASENKTIVDGKQIESISLLGGEKIQIGKSTIVFREDGAEEAAGRRRIVPVISGKGEELPDSDAAAIEELNSIYRALCAQLEQVIVGQHDVIEQVLIAVFCRGHALLVGAPGLAKTLLVSSLSNVLDLSFKRIQFTPDLMPTDITGTDVLEEDANSGKRSFRFVKGPIFANMVLADEINRTPPKTQASLLEAMQERHVTVGDRTYDLPDPFFVLATQNPIEQEGTFPLPEAQLDRFMFSINVGYPSAEEEELIMKQVSGTHSANLDPVLDGEKVGQLQELVKRVPVADHVVTYARQLVRATRPRGEEAPDFIHEYVTWGAGPRAGISLLTAAKAHAILHGRHHATTEDVNAIVYPVLRHRVMTSFSAEASGVDSDEVIRRLLEVHAPAKELASLKHA